MDGGLRGGGLLDGPKRSGLTLRIPRRQVFGLGQPLEEFAHIWIGLGIGDQRGVVDIPALLSPGIEHDLFPGVIGVQGGDHTFDGIVEKRRAHPYLVAGIGNRACRQRTAHTA